jgi:hypothetical protein
MSSQRQYKRHVQIIVGKDGKGLLIEENLRIVFEVVKDIQSSPNTANIKIYNLNAEHIAQIGGEFTDVIVNAGYEGGMRVVFRGNIKRAYRYREGNDYLVEIDAGDGDNDFRGAVINETLAAGTSDSQVIDRCLGSFLGGTNKGHIAGIPATGRLRGKVISSSTRDVLSKIAAKNNCNWSIQDGQLQIVPVNDVLPSQAFVVNADTGMLNAPEQEDTGIRVKTLLNPQYQIDGRIQLDNKDIREKRGGENESGNQESPSRLDPDGIYKIVKLTHKGDTHGNDWYSDIETVALG